MPRRRPCLPYSWEKIDKRELKLLDDVTAKRFTAANVKKNNARGDFGFVSSPVVKDLNPSS